MSISWNKLTTNEARRWTCGHCGAVSGTGIGYFGRNDFAGGPSHLYIYICTSCNEPTYWDRKSNQQIPGVAPGVAIEAVPDEVGQLYEEARRCLAAGAPTAASMACRKILMNLAVSQGAEANKQFAFYVDWLAENGFIPPGGRGWVSQIKDIGNEANHEVPHIEPENAAQVLRFTEGLLRFVYEFPAQAAGDGAAEATP